MIAVDTSALMAIALDEAGADACIEAIEAERDILGDRFAYDVAQEYGCPLLYVGNGFSKTDVQGVL